MATLWLDRPEKRNAMGPDFWSDLPRAMAAIGSDPGVRAVVVAARGPHFSVGLDLVAMSGLTGAGADPARVRPGRWPPGPGRPGPRSSACRPRSPPWPTARCRSSPPSTATASGAASTSSPPATSGWPAQERRLLGARGQGGHRGRPGQPAAAPGHHRPGARGRAGLHRQGHHARRGPRRSGWSTRSAPTPTAVAEAARALAAEIAANSPLAVQGTKAVLAAGAGPVGGRRARVRGDLERRVPGLRRPDRGHDGLHGEATGRVHRPLGDSIAVVRPGGLRSGWLSAGGATSGGRGARCARPPCAPRPRCRARPR